MDIATNAAGGDETMYLDGLSVYLEKEANKWLDKATIDYTEGRGFVISGMAGSSCGHGH